MRTFVSGLLCLIAGAFACVCLFERKFLFCLIYTLVSGFLYSRVERDILDK